MICLAIEKSSHCVDFQTGITYHNMKNTYLQLGMCVTHQPLPYSPPLPSSSQVQQKIVGVNDFVDPGDSKHEMVSAMIDMTYQYMQDQSCCRQDGKPDRPQCSGHTSGRRQGSTSVCSLHRDSRHCRLKHQCTQW